MNQVADRFNSASLLWLGVIALTLASVYLQEHLDWLARYPETWGLPFAEVLNAISNWMVGQFSPFFQILSLLLSFDI